MEEVVGRIRSIALGGVDHIVEVAFDANITADATVFAQGGSVAAYATAEQNPPVPFWPLAFKNIRVVFLGSDDFPPEVKFAAAHDLNAALEAKWSGFESVQTFPLPAIAETRESIEHRKTQGRVVVVL